MRENGQALIGSPKTIINNIKYIYDELGIEEILLQIEFGSQPFEMSECTLKLFINEVMPNFSNKVFKDKDENSPTANI